MYVHSMGVQMGTENSHSLTQFAKKLFERGDVHNRSYRKDAVSGLRERIDEIVDRCINDEDSCSLLELLYATAYAMGYEAGIDVWRTEHTGED